MATDRKDTKVTRLDLRIPNDIYAQIEEIAKANNAPSHHITNNIILSPTLLKLISLGIRSLSDNYSELVDISQPSDTSSSRIDAIEGELAAVKKSLIELSDKLSDTVPDKVPDKLSDTIPDRREEEIKMVPSSPPSPTTADTATNQTLSWSEFGTLIGEDMPPKGEKKDRVAGQKMVELGAAKGFTGWKYNSNKSRFEVSDNN